MIDELDPRSRALLDEEAGLDEPTAAELEATRASVFANLGLPLPPLTPTAPPREPQAPPPPASSGVAMSGTAKAIVGLFAAATIATVAVVTWPSARPAPPSRVATPAAVPAPTRVTTPEAPTPVAAPQVAVTPPPIDAPRPTVTRPPVNATEIEPEAPPRIDTPEPTPEDLLAEQSMLVAAAEAQLRAGHASEALSLFDRSLARHPTGTLRLESLSGRIAALCRLGRTDEGRAELTRFLASYPRSPSAPRLRSACGVEE